MIKARKKHLKPTDSSSETQKPNEKTLPFSRRGRKRKTIKKRRKAACDICHQFTGPVHSWWPDATMSRRQAAADHACHNSLPLKVQGLVWHGDDVSSGRSVIWSGCHLLITILIYILMLLIWDTLILEYIDLKKDDWMLKKYPKKLRSNW